MMKGTRGGRIQVASRALGVGRPRFDDALRYAQERQSVRQADLEAPVDRQLPRGHGDQLTAARQLVHFAARRYDAGERADMEAGMAKLFASEAAMEIALNAIGSTADTATRPSSTSNATSATRR
jgi:alkylation response protein AidB-like acyl-CoA dehydrogenase